MKERLNCNVPEGVLLISDFSDHWILLDLYQDIDIQRIFFGHFAPLYILEEVPLLNGDSSKI